MRKWRVLLILTAVGLAALPDASQGFFRRRCRPAPCSCAPVVSPCVPAWQPGYAMPQVAPGTSPRQVAIKGRMHVIIPTVDPGQHDIEELEAPPGALGKGKVVSDPNAFNGKARRIAKTSILDAPTDRPFETVNALFGTLPDSQHMMGLHIGTGPNVNRVAEEKHNVRVTGFIYVFRKESDNDYHVIIGDAPGTPNPQYLNVEVSGIPVGGSDANRAQLQEVRKTFKETFGLGDFGPDTYHRLHPPVPVQITGSLFWDSEHEPPQTVGPLDFKPRTAWEIHPISAIEFLD